MTIFSLLLALSICAYAFAQQGQVQQQERPALLGSVDVRLNIKGNAFNVRFEPEKETAQNMAKMLCTQRADMLGVTADTLPACVEEIGSYLQSYVDRWLAEKVLNVPLTIEGKSFDLSFIPERSDSVSVARRFCSEQSTTLGVTAESLNSCVEPVATYVQRAVNNFFVEKTLQLPVKVKDQTFTVSFLPERHAPLGVALKLCRDNAVQLGITTEEVLQECAQKVGQTLTQAVDAWVDSKTLSVPMTANGKSFTISFMPERESAVVAARNFCVKNAKDFGLTSDEALIKNCAEPAAEYLTQQVNKWIESKRLVVPVQVADQTVRLSLFPERESSVDVSRRFCVTNAASMNLTNDNIVDRCISPLNDIVAKAITEWAKNLTPAPTAPPASA